MRGDRAGRHTSCHVKLELSSHDSQLLTMTLLYAAGLARQRNETDIYRQITRLTNVIHKDVPNWTPYEIPASASPEQIDALLVHGEVARLQQLLRTTTTALEALLKDYCEDAPNVFRASISNARALLLADCFYK